MPGSRKIRVVCSDKGQHAESSFGHCVAWPDGDEWRVKLFLDHRGDEYVDMGSIAAAERGDSASEQLSKTYPLECRRCGRNTPLRAETIKKIAAAFAADGKRKIDTSDMPKMNPPDLST